MLWKKTAGVCRTALQKMSYRRAPLRGEVNSALDGEPSSDPTAVRSLACAKLETTWESGRRKNVQNIRAGPYQSQRLRHHRGITWRQTVLCECAGLDGALVTKKKSG